MTVTFNFLWKINYLYSCSKLELQLLRDKRCTELWAHRKAVGCSGRLFARYERHTADSVRKWRCYYENALTRDRSRYDTIKKSRCYHSNSRLESFTNEGEYIYIFISEVTATALKMYNITNGNGSDQVNGHRQTIHKTK